MHGSEEQTISIVVVFVLCDFTVWVVVDITYHFLLNKCK